MPAHTIQLYNYIENESLMSAIYNHVRARACAYTHKCSDLHSAQLQHMHGTVNHGQ